MKSIVFTFLTLLFSTYCLGQSGTLDPTFGNGGILTTNGLNMPQNSAFKTYQRFFGDYFYVAATNIINAPSGSDQSDLVILKYHKDGTPVSSFGNNGRRIINLGNLFDEVGGFQILSNGDLLIASRYNEQVAISKLNANGNFVTSFGNNGTLIIDFTGQYDLCFGLEIVSDGSAYVVGLTDDLLCMAKVTQSGALNTSFGNGGKKVFQDIACSQFLSVSKTVNDHLIITTSTKQLVKISPDGNLDISFGNSGKVSTSILDYSNYVLEDGKIAVLGSEAWPNDYAAIELFNPDGSKVLTFGVNGKKTFSVSGTSAVILGAFVSEGSFFLTGFSSDNILSMKTDMNGSLDTNFSQDGFDIISQSSLFEYGACASVFSAENHFYLTGTSGKEIIVALYFSNDIVVDPLVHIPDFNFKSYLLNNHDINTNGDSEIQISEAEAFNGTIDCSNKNITELTGIEAFKNIEVLRCNNNNISSIDLSNNFMITEFSCQQNKLTDLDLKNNINLTEVSCDINKIAILDVSNNLSLKLLSCSENMLTNLDVSKNTNLINLYCSVNNLVNLNIRNNPTLVNLDFRYNQITSIDLSQNYNLNVLFCDNNNLTELNCSSQSALTRLFCRTNQLTNLDIRNGFNQSFVEIKTDGNDSLSCIQVDDADWSKANWSDGIDFIFDIWTHFNEDCNKVSSVSKIEFNKKGFFYPNPATSIITIVHPSSVKIYDFSGRKIISSTNASQVDISTLPSGIYIVERKNLLSNQINRDKLVKY